MTVKKAIVLLHQNIKESDANRSSTEILNFKINNFEIVDELTLSDQYCTDQLQKLIQLIYKQKLPVSLIINQSIISSASNIILWSVIETLFCANSIQEIWLFRKNWQVSYRDQTNRAYTC